MTSADATPEYADDPSVGDNEEVWRRIPVDGIFRDKITREWRPQSGMFSDSRDGSPMSAHRARCYDTPEQANVGNHLMVGLKVRFLRGLNLGVATEPMTEDPGHLWIFGKKTASTKKKMARHATWVLPPVIR